MADQVLTLLEAAKLSKPSEKTGIVGVYADSYPVLRHAPVLSTGGSSIYQWNQEDDLPDSAGSTAVRNINSDFDATQATSAPFEVQMKIYGGKIKVDEYIYDHSPASVAFQKQSQINSKAKYITTDIFEGAGGSYIRGVRDWVSNEQLYSGQVVNGSSSTANGDLLSTNMMDEALSKIELIPGQTAMYGNMVLARRLKAIQKGVVSSEHSIQYYLNEFGIASGSDVARGIYTVYDNVPFYALQDGKNNAMLSAAERDGANANDSTCSLYIVTWGPDMATLVSSNGDIAANGVPMPKVSEHTDGSNYQYHRMSWYVNFVPHKPRSIVRVKFLKNAVA